MAEAVGGLEAGLREGGERLASLEEALGKAHRALARLEAERARLLAHQEARAARLAQVREELGEVDGRLEALEREMEEARAREEAARRAVEGLESRRRRLEAQRPDLARLRAQARKAREAAHRLELRVQALRHERASVLKELERLERQAQGHRRRIQEAEALLEREGPLLDQAQARLAGRLEARQALERQKQEAEEALARVSAELKAKEEAQGRLASAIASLGERLEQGHLDVQALEVRCQTAWEEVRDMGFDLQALLQALPEEADEADWQVRIEKAEASLKRLGAVNLAAVEELEQEQARMGALEAQCADIEEALATLQRAIQAIDRETRARFRDTFERLNGALKGLFPRLFGGGEAALVLEGDDLSGGVVLMARPPGKRNTSLQLLSGGEKALAALALVFAFFSLNPAPFCLMDEVDAPLDDANVERFCTLVKEMAAGTQFIIVTHNKLTMEMADQLVGVTMQEPGVSRLVAVDVEGALGMAV